MIIGLTGKKGAGKTTTVELLKEMGKSIASVNFKDALIRELKMGFPGLLEHLSTQYGLTVNELFERKPPVVRKLLQNYGTEVRRLEDIDYWVKKWEDAVDITARRKYDAILVDDVRFENEAEAIRRAGGIIVRIDTNNSSDDKHKSETEQDSIEADMTILNEKRTKVSFIDALEPLLDIIDEEAIQCEN